MPCFAGLDGSSTLKLRKTLSQGGQSACNRRLHIAAFHSTCHDMSEVRAGAVDLKAFREEMYRKCTAIHSAIAGTAATAL